MCSLNHLLGLWTIFWCAAGVNSTPTVHITQGDLAGYYMRTRNGRQIAAYTSIPYAEPPVGELRFKEPVPAGSWKGVRDATKSSPPCVQRNPYTRQAEIVGQEDCLYLNVYTPYLETFDTLRATNKSSKLLPVMLWIHGGGLMCGDSSTDMYGPEYLLDRDVVFVATNYRLGPLGFLSTQDAVCPGNNGMKDQQEALRWIHRNINAFGGDPDSVTVFGESAGGSSAHYHMLSPTSAGLLHKAISLSGTALVPWAEAPPGEALRQAFKLAKFLGCPQAPSDKMLACLRKKDAYEIIDTEFMFYDWDYDPMTPFKVVVEPDLPGAFLTRSPREIPSVPAIPWMTGLTKDEGCLKSVWITANKTRLEEFVSGFDAISPISFYYHNNPHVNEINKKLRKFYLESNKLEDAVLLMYSESYFNFPLVDAAELAFKYSKSPIFLYQLTYRATNSFSQIFGDPKGDYGVCHADDLLHLFPIHFLNKPVSAKDVATSQLLVTLLTNFATSGNPNYPVKLVTACEDCKAEWLPASSSDSMEYMEIGRSLKMKTKLAQRSRIWGELPLWFKKKQHRFYDEL